MLSIKCSVSILMSTKMYMQEYTPYAVYQVLCVNLDVHKDVHVVRTVHFLSSARYQS